MKKYPSIKTALASMSPGEIALCTVAGAPYAMREEVGLICCDTGGVFWGAKMTKIDVPKETTQINPIEHEGTK